MYNRITPKSKLFECIKCRTKYNYKISIYFLVIGTWDSNIDFMIFGGNKRGKEITWDKTRGKRWPQKQVEDLITISYMNNP
jgi:hypothetical protein